MRSADNAGLIEVQTGTRYKVDADGDGTVRVQFTAVLEAVELELNGNFAYLRFDNSVRLYVFNAEGGFEMEKVDG